MFILKLLFIFFKVRCSIEGYSCNLKYKKFKLCGLHFFQFQISKFLFKFRSCVKNNKIDNVMELDALDTYAVYTIMNTHRLSIYTSMNSFYHSNIE
jgi:hypothetical protein